MSLYKKLFVARYGFRNDKCNDSCMITNKITQIIQKNNIYKFDGSSFMHINQSNLKYIDLYGIWKHPIEKSNKTNILGGIGIFLTNKSIEIPCNEGTASNYRLFGCHVVDKNEELIFDIKKDMPIFEMEVGKNYINNYILNPECANGMYLEYHNTPHLYIACNEESAGYLILAKKLDEHNYMVSALSVPHGKAVYLPPYTIHNDCFLIGKYNVMYNSAEDFSTVRLVNKDNINEFTNIKLV